MRVPTSKNLIPREAENRTFELWKLRLRYDDEAGSAERQVSAQGRVFV